MTLCPDPGGHHLSPGLSGALCQFAYWVANGTVATPVLEGIDYWDDTPDPPSLMEQVFAIFANVLVLDDEGNPVNAKQAERRAAMWIRQYCTGVPGRTPSRRVGGGALPAATLK